MNYVEFRKRYRWNAKTDKLGEGGFGKVYRALDTLRDRPVVLKIADVPTDHKFSLQREVELNRDLTPHPNLAQFRNCYRLEDEYGEEKDYATMDYFPEGSLNVVMLQPLSPDDIRSIATGMLRGLAHLEREKVIHRDFKPGNVLMARDEQGAWLPKIADFGLSRFTSTDITVSNSSVGISYDYAAPEQFRPGSVNRQADLWAFGVIIYRLCLNHLPFTVQPDLTGESRRLELIRLINQAELPTDVSEIAEPYQRIIRRCLVKELPGRVKSADELLELLTAPVTKPEPIMPLQLATETVVQVAVAVPANMQPLPLPEVMPTEIRIKPQPGEAIRSNPEPVRLTPPVRLEKSKPVFATASSNQEQANKQNKYPLLLLLTVVLCGIGAYFLWQSQQPKLKEPQISTVNSTTTTPNQVQPDQYIQSSVSQNNTASDPIKDRLTNASVPAKTISMGERQPKPATPVVKPAENPANNPIALTPAVNAPVENQPEPSRTSLVDNPVPAGNVETPTNKPDNRNNPARRTLRLSGGTEVVVALSEAVAAENVKAGQRVSLEVSRPVMVDGEVVIARGADVQGEVAKVSTGGKKDMLEIRIRSIQGVSGQSVDVRSATFRYVGSRNEPLVFKAGQQFVVYTAGAHKFSL